MTYNVYSYLLFIIYFVATFIFFLLYIYIATIYNALIYIVGNRKGKRVETHNDSGYIFIQNIKIPVHIYFE